MAGAIVSKSIAVGIDMERISDRVLRVRQKFLSEQEWQWVQSYEGEARRDLLTLLWTIKETVYKWYNRPGTLFNQGILIDPFQLETTGLIPVRVGRGHVQVTYSRVLDYYLSYITG